jgi:hypothetical protein
MKLKSRIAAVALAFVALPSIVMAQTAPANPYTQMQTAVSSEIGQAQPVIIGIMLLFFALAVVIALVAKVMRTKKG